MPRGSSTEKLFFSAAVSALLICMCGCRGPQEVILTGDWISLMIRKAGIMHTVSAVPYYLNIPDTSVYFEDIQTAVDWDILSQDVPVDPDAPLTREMAAYTLINLAGLETENEHLQIKDLSASRFPDQVKSAVACGLMKLDSRSRFQPSAEVEKSEAEKYLDQIIDHINSRQFADEPARILWEEGEDAVFEECESYDEDTGTAVFPKDSQIREGQLFVASGENGPRILEAAECSETEEGIVVKGEEDGVFDHIQDLHMQGSVDADFTKAEIRDLLSEQTIQEAYSFTEPAAFSFMALRPLRKTNQFGDFTISYEIASSGINAEVKRESPSGLSVGAAYSLSNLHVDYDWNMKNRSLKNAYFRVSCMMQESLGASRSKELERYANPAVFTKDSFLSSVRSAFHEKTDAAELEIPLCAVRLPIPGAPVADLYCQLGLKIRADGRAEISFTQNFSSGMEVRNGSMRPIGTADNAPKAMLQASASLLGEAKIALNTASIRLTDIVLEGGLNGDVVSTVHHYDADGSHTTATTALPADLVAGMSAAAENILVCSDIKADWVADVQLNSKGTAAAKLGLSGTVPIIRKDQGKAFLRSHMENFHFVDRCTRGDRQKRIQHEDPPETEQITLSAYSMILDAGESAMLKVTHIPDGYTMSDLVFESADPSVASISGGMVTAGKEGSTRISVRTADNKYRIRCSVTVRQEKTNADMHH